MKQIKIITLHKNEEITEETFYVNNTDMFLKDSLEELIKARIELDKVIGNNNITYSLEINEVNIVDNYDLYKFVKTQIDYTKENIEKYKKHNEKLVKVMKKWYI